MYDLQLFEDNQVEYNWATLVEGLKLNLLQIEAVGKYAEKFMSSHPHIHSDHLIELAWGQTHSEETINLLKKIVREIGVSSDVQVESRKWRYCILRNLRQEAKNDGVLLEKAAEIYSDFDYPEDMEGFIYYLEPKDHDHPADQSKEGNVAKLIKNLDEFLEQERKLLSQKK